jgi:ribosomal protein L28
MKKIFTLAAVAVALPLLSACQDDAAVASRNLSKAADNFEVNRRIIFYNGITDAYMLVIEGFCSLDISSNALRVTCKVGPNEFKKHQLGLSDNVTFFAEQLESKNVSVNNYRVTFKPQQIIPDIDLRGGAMTTPTINRGK